MARSLQLSWIPLLKQWRKRRKVNGKTKTYYLGTGGGKADQDSYLKALAKWRSIEREIIASEAVERAKDAYAAWARRLGHLPDNSEHAPMSADEKQSYLATPEDTERDSLDPLRYYRPTTIVAKKDSTTLGKHIDGYISEQQQRYEHGRKFPNAPRSERISAQRFIAYRYNANLLKTAWGSEPLPPDEAAIAKLMRTFRDSQNKLLLDDALAPGTFNERIKTMRHFVGWLHDHYLIPSLPRKIETLCSKYQVKATARAIDLKIIKRLWAEATECFRCYMALGLNCGFYAVDIASLEHSQIKENYIMCDRHKTGVPTRFKLWTVTKRLLREQANGKDSLAFVADDGGPLLTIDTDGKGKRWSKIDNDLLAMKKKLGLNNLSFSNFRDTSSTKIESIDRKLTDLFDGHKDSRMARFYIDNDHVDYDRMFTDLDQALNELEIYYGLE